MVSAECISEGLEFKVKDTGIGMPQDMLPSIFQMFRQLDSSNTRSYGGPESGSISLRSLSTFLAEKSKWRAF